MLARYHELRPSIEDVCAKALHLPCSPAILPRLAAALQSDVTSAAQIQRLISLDTSLATATLRLANSGLYGPCAVDTLEGAILRLGAKELFRLAALVLIGRWGSGLGEAGFDPGEFSRHTLVTAIAAEVLAEATGLVDTDLAYTAGLVNEVGRLAIMLSCGPYLPMIRTHRQLRHSTWEEAEYSVLGFSNADLSWRLLSAWRFPPILAETARDLAAPQEASAEVAPLVAHVHAARFLAASIEGRDGEVDAKKPSHLAFLKAWQLTLDRIVTLAPVVSARVADRWGGELAGGTLMSAG